MNNKFLIASALCMSMSATMNAQNPIVQTQLTTDPAPLVVGDRLYVYTGHDEDKADFFWMNEWRVYSTKDMVNWTDHGSPLDLSFFPGLTTVPGQHRLSNVMVSITGISVRTLN